MKYSNTTIYSRPAADLKSYNVETDMGLIAFSNNVRDNTFTTVEHWHKRIDRTKNAGST